MFLAPIIILILFLMPVFTSLFSPSNHKNMRLLYFVGLKRGWLNNNKILGETIRRNNIKILEIETKSK